MTPFEFIQIVRHNNKVRKEWRDKGKPIVFETIGWRPNPNGGDGYRDNGDGSYSKLICGGTVAYCAKFEKDVEKSSHPVYEETDNHEFDHYIYEG